MDTDEGLLKPPLPPPPKEDQDQEETTDDFSADSSSISKSKQGLSHTNSFPGSQHISPTTEENPTSKNVFKHQSFRIKRNKEDMGQPPAGPGQRKKSSSSWSFGGVAKAVGSGVTAFGSGVAQGTRAVGSGVVKGTKAVGSGVVQGTKAVGTGVVEGTKAVGSGAKVVASGVIEGTQAVGSGVVEGTKVVASVSKDVTMAAGSKVVQAGDLAMTSVNAVGEATVSAATATADAVKSAVHESLGKEGEVHVVLPGESIEAVAEKYEISKRDLIRANSLCRRSLRAGQELIIPSGDALPIVVHPNEILVLKATNEHDQEGVVHFGLESIIWSESGDEKYIMEMANVRNIGMDLANDLTLPELLPPATPTTEKNDVEQVFNNNDEGTNDDDDDGKPDQAMMVLELNQDDDQSPEEDDSMMVRVDFTLYANEGVNPEDEDSTSSSSDQENNKDKEDQKEKTCENFTKSFLFERSNLMSLATYLELWHAEVLKMSPRLASLVSRQKDLYSAFSTFTPTSTQDLMANVMFNGDGRSAILSESHLQQLFASLPPKIQTQPWTLTYSTGVNGFSLRNMYRSVAGGGAAADDSAILRRQVSGDSTGVVKTGDQDDSGGACLIIIQNMENRIFGSFLTCYPSITDNFVGTGKSWLFAFGGRRRRSGTTATADKLRIYKWSGLNEHFYRGTSDNIIIGADEGRFGIFIDGDLHKGRVQECATFQNWPLADLEEDFVIGCLEVWTFESPES